MITLELLPNEILIECFEYLNAFEIFYSFDKLNYRFYKLIRNIRLYLNFQHVSKATFDQFCTTMKSNPQIQKHIYSLQLSNQDTCGQIKAFLSIFSLDTFSHLQSLKLFKIEENNIDTLKSMLPLMSELYSLDWISPKNGKDEILPVLSMPNLRILSAPTLQCILTHPDKTSVITHLTVSICSLDQLLYQLFRCAPMLKYLNVHNIYKNSHSMKNEECVHHPYVIHLKHLIIGNFGCTFEEFEMCVKQIPNLKRLTISALDNICIIDAYRWECLIKTSLSFLTVFQFIFGVYRTSKIHSDIVDKFKQFQTNFWQEDHHWYTEYVLDINSAVIYTIPYLLKSYRLTSSTNRYSNKLMNNSSTFDNVTDLTLCYESITEKDEYYFSNVTSLKLESKFINSNQNDNSILTIKYIKSLKTIINLFNLKHLDISTHFAIETLSLLEILKEAPQLTSMKINLFILSTLFNDEELCNYLNKMIKKLSIFSKYDQYSFQNSNEVKQFCEIFSNLEQLTCKIYQSDQLLFLLNQLSRLSSMKVFATSCDKSERLFSWFEDEAPIFKAIHRMKYSDIYDDDPREMYQTELSIWTGGSIS